jgi:hypothetical protein
VTPYRNEPLIDGRQMMLLLVLGRMFSMMTYSPGKEAVPGSVTLAAQLPALAAELALLAFSFGLMRHWGGGLLETAFGRSRPAGIFCAVVCLAVCWLQAAQTITVQADFLTGTIYRLPHRIGLIVALWAGTLYVVWLGLESFARLAMGVFVVFVLLAAALAIQGLPNIDLLNLHNPLEEGVVPLAKGAALSVARCGELGAAVLLSPTVRGKAGNAAAKAGVIWTGFTAAISFLVLTVLGSFAATRSYPVYTLALAGGEQAVFGRLDALLLLVWIFLAVVRGGLYWWLADRCLFLLGIKAPGLCLCLGGIPILAAALFGPLLKNLWNSPLLWGGTVL